MKRKIIIIVVAVCGLVVAACHGNGGSEPVKLQGQAQGTYYSIIYYDKEGRNLQAEIDSLLREFDMTASLWEEESLIRKINENRDSVVNKDFVLLLEMSKTMNEYSGGAFDCTIGKLVNAWGFGFSKREEMSDAVIDSLLQYVGQQPTIVRDSEGRPTVRKASPEATIDFNAIAQGYSTDKISRFLDNKGIENYLVDIGGEVYAKGCKPDSSAWMVGIERPAENRYSSPEVEMSIELRDKAVVTSGSYRKYYEKDGVRYSHTIDPKTGRPVEHTLLSVSVVDESAWRADALATAFMVMGLERAKRFIEEHPEDTMEKVVFIYSDGEGYKVEEINN